MPEVADIPQQPEATTGGDQPDPRRTLYDKLSAAHLYTKSYDDFNQKFSDPGARQKLFDGLSGSQLYTKSREDFDKQYFANADHKDTAPAMPQVPGWNDTNKIVQGVNNIAAAPASAPISQVEFAQNTLKDAWKGADDAIKDHLMDKMDKDAADLHQNLGIDNTSVKQYLPPEIAKRARQDQRDNIPQDQIDGIKNDPATNRFVVHQLVIQAKKKGDIQKANDIAASSYIMDSKDRATGVKAEKIAKNADAIKKGELIYNTETGDLAKPVGVFEAIKNGYSQRTHDYQTGIDLASADEKSGIDLLKRETGKLDPDNPQPVHGSLSESIGSEGLLFTKAALGGAVAGMFTDNPAIVNTAATAATADEVGNRSFKNEAVRTFAQVSQQLRHDHPEMPESEIDHRAYQKAINNGKIAAASDIAMTGLMTASGLRLGRKPLDLNFGQTFKSAVKAVGKGAVDLAVKGAPEGLANAAIAGGIQATKNELSNAQGIHRDASEGVLDAGKGMLWLHYGLGALMHGANAIPKVKNAILQGLADKPPEVVREAAKNMVAEGSATPEQAHDALSQIYDQTTKEVQIPAHVTDPNARLEIHDKVDQYNANKALMGKPEDGGIHEAYHPAIKDKNSRLQWEINMLSAPPENQVKILKDKQAELQNSLDAHNEAKRSGEAGKLDFPDADRAQLKMVKDKLDEVQSKVDSPIYKAAKIIKEGNIKGFSKDILEDAANTDHEKLGEYLKNIADQLHDPSSRETTIDTYGKRLTDVVEQMYPKPESSKISVIRPGETNQPTSITTIKPSTDAVPIESAGKVGVRQQDALGETVGTRNTQSKGFAGTQEGINKESEDKVASEKIINTSNVDNKQPFQTTVGHIVTHENGDLVVTSKNGKLVSGAGRKRAIQEYADNFDFSHGESAGDIPAGITHPDEVKRFILEKSGNPYEIAEIYAHEEPAANSLSAKDQMIADFGIGKIKRGSYIEFGDRNNIGMGKAKAYFNEAGSSLDVVAKEMSDHYGKEITPQDLVDFIDKHPNGESSALRKTETPISIEAAAKFKELTGLQLNHEVAQKAIDQQFNKLSESERELEKANYESEQQLQDEYWDQFEKSHQSSKEGDFSASTQRGGIPSSKKAEVAPPTPPADDLPLTDEPRDAKLIGITHQAQVERLGEEAVKRGEGVTAQEAIQHGRGLLDEGKDPQKAADEFKKDGKISFDSLSLVRAEHERLAKETNAAIEKFGEKSPEAKAAFEKEGQWLRNVVKPMQTEWSKIGTAQQGRVDIDTGTFVGMRRAFQEETGKDFSPTQEAKAKELVEKVKSLSDEVEGLKKKLDDAIIKDNSTKTQKQPKSANIKEQSKAIAAKIRSGKLSRPDNFSAATPASLVWDAAVEVAAKTVEASGTVAQAIADGIAHIKTTDWYNGLSEDKQKGAEKAFEDVMSDKLGINQPKLNTQEELATHFAGKTDNAFTQAEVNGIWNYIKKQYLDTGVGISDSISKTGTDLGLSSEQVKYAISQPKSTKIILDELYKKQAARVNAVNYAKEWVTKKDSPALIKAIKALPSAFFSLKTAGHGTVAPITHAGMNIFQPSKWQHYFPFMAKSWKFAFGNEANYFQAMADLKNAPDFIFWKRAGLAVDPKETYDEYQGASKMLGKLGFVGVKGFNALKVYRIDLARSFYDKLSDFQKSDPTTATEIAKLVNHSTGTSEVEMPAWMNTIFFAPKLEASRWQGLITDPAKAVSTFARWGKATQGEKAAALIVARNAGEKMATYAALLAANAGTLAAAGSKQKINLKDPSAPDWLRFKAGDQTIDVSGGTLATMRFMEAILGEAGLAYTGTKKDLKKKPNDLEGQKLLTQLRYKESPFASTVTDIATGTDAMGRPLPFSHVKARKGEEPHTIFSYTVGQQLPIPLAEAYKAMTESMKGSGMSNPHIKDILYGIMVGGVSGFSGAKVADDKSLEQKKRKH